MNFIDTAAGGIATSKIKIVSSESISIQLESQSGPKKKRKFIFISEIKRVVLAVVMRCALSGQVGNSQTHCFPF